MADPKFFVPSRSYSAGELAELTGAELANPALAGVTIERISSIGEGGSGSLVFVERQSFAEQLAGLDAAAILCPQKMLDLVPAGVAALVSRRPGFDFARIAALMYPTAARPTAFTAEAGVSPLATVADGAVIEPGAIVEGGAVIGAGAGIGRGTVIAPGAIIGPECQIGRDSYIGPGATVMAALLGDRVVIHAGTRIGQEGFGFLPSAQGLKKIPQIGRVVLQDDVEIGANSTVDRGALGDTIIGQGTKIDNLVQVGHNVRIGRHCAIAAHSGISGSVTIGDYVLLGGRVGISDHVTIGDGVHIAAAAGVMHDIPAGQRWAGAPAQPVTNFFREVSALRKLAGQNRRKGKGDV